MERDAIDLIPGNVPQNTRLNFVTLNMPENVLGEGTCALIIQAVHTIHHDRRTDNLTTNTRLPPT